jgi:phosphatidylserine/phosphatidylglycerophosphate/cardiolipin synthase-like enzyme
MSEIEVWVQADVLSVRTTLVPKSRTSALETMLLKAIRKGVAHADDLCDIFGLAPRLVESILGDLWRAGRISIDLGTEREVISLTSAAREELDALGEDGSVSSTAGSGGTEEVAHDRLTGRVLPLQATRRNPGERGLVVPTMTDDPDPSDLRESDLAEAVTRTLSWRAAEDASVTGRSPAADSADAAGTAHAAAGTADPAAEPDDNPADWLSDLRINTAYLTPALLQASRERRYIPVRVQAVEDATGALTVRVTDDRLSLRTRELAGRRLNGLIADRPTSRFVSQLRGNSHRSPARERDLGQLIADLQSVVNAQPAPDPAGRQRAHDRAAALAHDIEAYTNALGLAEMNVTVIASGEQHIAAVNEMLRGARRQVVIAVPWVKQRGVLDIRDALIAAVGGGVQVTLLWGIASGTQPLDPRVLATLDEIEEHARRSSRGGALRYHRERGGRSHAKVVVADDRELLITGKNFLSGSELTEVGLRLTVPKQDPGQLPLACQAISDVLQFLYDHTPDPTTAAQLIRTRGAFGPRQDRSAPSPTPLPRLTAAVLNPDAPPEHARAWAAAWQDAARTLAGRAARSRPTVEVIKDGQHAGLVREAFEDASYRVLIASHRVSEQALTAELCELARARAAKGVDVAVRYGEVMDDTSADRLEELAAARDPDPPDVQKRAGMHAKVVIRDSSTVLGSFNHLSVDAGVRGLRATGELSVRISSAAVGDEVWQALMERPPRRSRVPAAASPAGSAAGAPTQLLLDLLEPADGLPDVDRLAELVQAEGASEVLATAQRLGLGTGARRRVLAAAAIPVLAVPGADRDSRLSALMPALWETGAWACADLIRRTISEPGLSPRTVLTSALADPDGYSAALWAVVTGQQELTPAEAEVVAVSAAVGLLLDELDSPELVELLHSWERRPAPRSDEFVISAVDY